VDGELARVAEPVRAFGVAARAIEIMQIDKRGIDGGEAARFGVQDDGAAGVQHFFAARRARRADVTCVVLRAEDQPRQPRIGCRDLVERQHAGAAFDDRQQRQVGNCLDDGGDVGGAFGLGEHNGVGRRSVERREVVLPERGADGVDADDADGAPEIDLVERGGNRFARGGFAIERNAIFEIEDDGIGVECGGFIDLAAVVAGHEEQGAQRQERWRVEAWGVRHKHRFRGCGMPRIVTAMTNACEKGWVGRTHPAPTYDRLLPLCLQRRRDRQQVGAAAGRERALRQRFQLRREARVILRANFRR